MPCWVVPQLAAEFWSTTVEQILDRVKNGSIASLQMDDFTFVDIDTSTSASLYHPSRPAPQTFIARQPQPQPLPTPSCDDTTDLPDDQAFDFDQDQDEDQYHDPDQLPLELTTDNCDLSQWRTNRLRVANQRIAPAQAA